MNSRLPWKIDTVRDRNACFKVERAVLNALTNKCANGAKLLMAAVPSEQSCAFGDVPRYRQVAAMDAWHRAGIGNRLRELNLPVLIATGTADYCDPAVQCVEAG
jgi:hypothetical protein